MRISLTRPIPASRFNLLFWIGITLVFLYERTYLIQKAGLPYFVECVVVRVGLLVLLCQFHLDLLLPRFYQQKAYWTYGILLVLTATVYLILQAGYDVYLFGYVIGDDQRRNPTHHLTYNLIATSWYLLLTTLIQRTRSISETPSTESHPVLPDADRIVFKSGTQWVRLPLTTIRYAQGLKDYSILYTDGGKHIMKGSIGKLADQLPASQFIRIHKSYLVSWQHVQSVSATEIKLSGQTLPLGRIYTACVLDRWRHS